MSFWETAIVVVIIGSSSLLPFV